MRVLPNATRVVSRASLLTSFDFGETRPHNGTGLTVTMRCWVSIASTSINGMRSITSWKPVCEEPLVHGLVGVGSGTQFDNCSSTAAQLKPARLLSQPTKYVEEASP